MSSSHGRKNGPDVVLPNWWVVPIYEERCHKLKVTPGPEFVAIERKVIEGYSFAMRNRRSYNDWGRALNLSLNGPVLKAARSSPKQKPNGNQNQSEKR